jgi:hypothetical protein
MKLRSTKLLKIVFPLVISIVINGCAYPALREINYDGQLAVDANVVLAKQFASDLAAETGLQISGVFPQSSLRRGECSNVFLSSKPGSNLNIGVVITTSEPKNTFSITVRGDIESPEASAITQKAVELFEKKYPDSKLTPFIRHAGPLGP